MQAKRNEKNEMFGLSMQINFKIRKNHIKSVKIRAKKGLNIKK